jgi:adenylate cyclase
MADEPALAAPRAKLRAAGLLRRGWRNVRAAGRRRLAVTLALMLLAVFIGRYSWELPQWFADAEVPLLADREIPVISNAERTLYDLRALYSAPQSEQDQRLQILAYTDQTLIALKKRSPLDRGLLARTLRAVDGMGAKAIGIDMLFDQPQDEDEELIAALRAMQTPVFVAYANVEGNRDDIIYEQQQFLDGFMARLEGSNARPASIRLDYAHGVTRRWPDTIAGLPPLLGRAMIAAGGAGEERAFAGYEGAVRYRLPPSDDRPLFSSLPIDLFADPATASALAGQIEGRYVLIGGELVDVDRVETPFTATTGQTVPGIQVHAEIIAQMLDGARPKALGSGQLWAIAVLVVMAAGLTALLEGSIWRMLPFLVAQGALILGAPFWLHGAGVDSLGLPAVGWAVAWVIAFMAVTSAARASGAVERKFAQSALGKYLPPDIAQEIIDHPERLTLSGVQENLYILFSDLEGFTKLSHQLEPAVVAKLLNDYLDRLSAVVLEHGGVIDKYVGDAVVAFWGAPIARSDDAIKAARAGYALYLAGEEFRRSVDPALPKIGKTRVGMHYGEAVVGNFGGERRIQYTALGDAMNTAARLESANKALDSSVMVSREFAERSGLDWWRPMGRVVLRGRSQPVDLFEPAPDFPQEDREAMAEALDRWDSDPKHTIAVIESLVFKHQSDTALHNLLHRLRHSEEGKAYALD